ncbi:MAG: LysR family transcriptional regulator [Anaerolineaceae bacterium]|nr:LysR family transcriptional regulator [Anaerolineaceae bacterium]
MELRQLKTFQVTASVASFTQAAVLLGYAQSSITAQIQALEKELGVALFDRVGRNVRLTDAGEKLLTYANRLLDLAAEAQAVVSENGRLEGSICIAAPETVCTYRLPAVLRHFRDSHPEIRLTFQPMLDKDIYHGVKNGLVDFGFLLQEPVRSEGLTTEILIDEPLLVFTSAADPLAASPRVRPEDLAGKTLLLTETGCGYRQLFEHAMTRAGIYSTVKLAFNSVEAIKQCVIAGLGIGFLPRVAIQRELDQGLLCPLAWETPFRTFTQLVYRKDKWLSPAMRQFARLSLDMLRTGESDAG